MWNYCAYRPNAVICPGHCNNSIFLLRWLQAGAPIPKVTVSDYSRAIINALCLTFNRCTLGEYVTNCFKSICDKSESRPANTFIRLDVAHLIFLVSRQKCFKKDMPVVNNFYVRGIALLISCNKFEKFQKILKLMLITSSHHYDGNLEGSNKNTSCLNAHVKLAAYIASEKN